MQPNHRRRRTQGFTLIELLVVIAIIALLAALLIPSFTGAQQRPFDMAAMQCGEAILSNAITYKAEHAGNLPATPFSPNVLGPDVQEVCTGQRVMAWAVPTSKTGTEYAINSLDSKGRPSFFVSNNKGSGVYVNNSDATNCAGGCKLKYLPWSAYGL